MKNRRRSSDWLVNAALAAGALEIILRVAPIPVSLREPLITSTEFVDRENRPLRTMLVDQRRYARHVGLSAISHHLIDATISAEDKRFRRHRGVDPAALARAIWRVARDQQTTSGASTITQQLAKLGAPGPRTFSRKLSEIWSALVVERHWAKERILEEYLNRLDYGNLQIGIASASLYYFGKPAADLSPLEAAFLAALPKAPARLEPHSNFAAAHARALWVLQRMHDDGALDDASTARARVQPIQILPPSREFEAPHFVDLLLQRKGTMPPTGGAVPTTLDLHLNQFIERSLADQLEKITDKHATSGAVVVIHNATGEVLALAGSGDYFRPGAGQINGAWSARSPGSAVKPFTYVLALERGANPSTVVPDVPTDFATATGIYSPNNYNHRFYGPVSLRFALGNSLNIAAIQTLQLAGGAEALHTALRQVGITTLGHPADYYGPGLTLGNAEVRLLELTNAYATIGRFGVYRSYRLLRNGGDAEPPHRIFDARASYLVADMLSDNSARAASFGLQSFLSFDFSVACKTGTSSDYRDNWALGFTPEFTVGVWVGNPDGSPMHGITGVTGAAPVLHDIFVHLHEQRGTSWFEPPPGLRQFAVHPLTGRRVPPDRAGAVVENCISEPEAERPSDYDADGRVVLSRDYAAWAASPQNFLDDLVTCAAPSQLRILAPAPGTIFFFDPDVPAVAQRVPLKAEATGPVEWSSDLVAADDGAAIRVELREGVHIISARDRASGRVAQTWIDVRSL